MYNRRLGSSHHLEYGFRDFTFIDKEKGNKVFLFTNEWRWFGLNYVQVVEKFADNQFSGF